MLVLAFDTSSRWVAVGLVATRPVDGAEQVDTWHGELDAPNRHGERLAPLIERVLGSAGVRPADLDAIGVGLGPGPFTGLRVGVVTAKTMGDALGIPTYGVCSLDVIAHRYRDRVPSFAVVTDARRKQVYWRRYNGAGHPEGPPEISVPTDLAEELRGTVDAVVGAGLGLYPDAFAGFILLPAVGDHPVGYPDGSGLSELVMQRALARAPGEDLTPMYLRRPDARPPGKPKQVTPA